jgi:diguanylate cyclase (GGDEF)-like protein
VAAPIRLAVLFVALLLAALPCAALPPTALQVLAEGDDDPSRALLAATNHARVAEVGGLGVDRFWWHVVQAMLLRKLERPTEATQAAAQAAALLAAGAVSGREAELWLRQAELWSMTFGSDSVRVLTQVVGLREEAEGLALARLACEARNMEAWLLVLLGSHEEAWAAGQGMERCGLALKWPEQQAAAQITFGAVLSQRLTDGETGLDPEPHYRRALALLGKQPARYLRSILAWELGLLHQSQQRHEQALAQFRLALEQSRELADDAGMAAAAIEAAAALLDLERAVEARPLLDDAARRLRAGGEADAVLRLPRALALRLRAISATSPLGGPELREAVAEARRWLDLHPNATGRAELQLATARALATAGRHAEAYATLESTRASEREERAVAHDAQLLRLRSQYAQARRAADEAEQKMRLEATRLELETQTQRNRALVAGVLALALLAAAAAAFAGRELARRRRMADLALRDELTGLPNRRAVEVYAAEQFAQAQRLDLPIAVAVVDMDHFKQVNDRFGHAAGDAVLRAFAQAAPSVLRGQDRIGRWGGEEWLLVMPGTRLAEVDGVHARLRERFAMTLVPGVPPGLECTFSMGVAERLPGQTLDQTIAAADQALYRAKQAGRDRLEHAALPAAA